MSYWQAPNTAQQPGSRVNHLAIISLVFGIVALLPLCTEIAACASVPLGVLAVVLGVLSLRQIKQQGQGGRPLALAGLVLGSIGIILGLVEVGIVLAAAFWALVQVWTATHAIPTPLPHP